MEASALENAMVTMQVEKGARSAWDRQAQKKKLRNQPRGQ